MSELSDRLAIAQAVQNWALWRDTGQWDRLRRLYTPDAKVHTTWFVGSAHEFIERSNESAKKGARVQHFVGASSVDLNGDKAIAESRIMLLVRAALEGTEVDVTCHGRFYDRFLRQAGEWRIAERIGIYEKDRIDPVVPGTLVKLDPTALARYPEGYRHLAYVQAIAGARITLDLPVPGSDVLTRVYEEGSEWLRCGASVCEIRAKARSLLGSELETREPDLP
jgi:hypothetical protein